MVGKLTASAGTAQTVAGIADFQAWHDDDRGSLDTRGGEAEITRQPQTFVRTDANRLVSTAALASVTGVRECAFTLHVEIDAGDQITISHDICSRPEFEEGDSRSNSTCCFQRPLHRGGVPFTLSMISFVRSAQALIDSSSAQFTSTDAVPSVAISTLIRPPLPSRRPSLPSIFPSPFPSPLPSPFPSIFPSPLP